LEGFGIASLVIGIFALLFCWIPYLGGLFGILAIIFYVTQHKRKPTGAATAGLVLGIIAIVFNIFFTIFWSALLSLGTAQSAAAASNPPLTGTELIAPSQTETPSATPASTKAQITYSINDIIRVDNIAYRVNSAGVTDKLGTKYLETAAAGKYVVVDLSLSNVGTKSDYIFSPRFILIDELGREYDRLPSDSLYLTKTIDFGQQVQPGVALEGQIAFEVPKNTNAYTLHITGDWTSTSSIDVKLGTPKTIIQEDPCQIDKTEYLLFGEKNQYQVGLKNFHVENKGTWYKITDGTIYARKTDGFWFGEDVSLSVVDADGTLVNSKVASIDLSDLEADGDCVTANVTFDIGVQNPLKMKTLSLSLGSGGEYYGTTYVTTSGDFNLTEFLT